MWSNARGVLYGSGAVAGLLAVVVVAMGWGTFDPATRQIDIAPFSVDALAALIPTVAAPFIAFVAWLKKWTRR